MENNEKENISGNTACGFDGGENKAENLLEMAKDFKPNAVLEGEGVAVKMPPCRPKSIKEASILARELFEM